MHRFIFLYCTILYLCFAHLFIGCKRDEPVSVNNQPVPVNQLELINSFKISVPEPSGLAYNSIKNCLATVSDANGTFYEIDFSGQVLSHVNTSCSDLEGITYSKNCDTVFVVQEKLQLVTALGTNGNLLYSIPVNVATNQNSGLEGISMNGEGDLIVLNEKSPMMLVILKNSAEISRVELNYTTDISDVFYDNSLNCLWVVSDESQLVLKLSTDGKLINKYTIPLNKGEGIAVVGEKMYIVSDSEAKLYVFKKPN